MLNILFLSSYENIVIILIPIMLLLWSYKEYHKLAIYFASLFAIFILIQSINIIIGFQFKNFSTVTLAIYGIAAQTFRIDKRSFLIIYTVVICLFVSYLQYTYRIYPLIQILVGIILSVIINMIYYPINRNIEKNFTPKRRCTDRTEVLISLPPIEIPKHLDSSPSL